jgi:xylan 1,4-beta-xylosidase
MGIKTRFGLLAVLSLAVLRPRAPAQVANASQDSETVVIDASAPAHPFAHFWEHMFGSGRAIVTLRESYRNDLRDVKKITGFEYVRFHAIFHDEVGIYDEDSAGHPLYNFSYVDQVYDGLLANGVRPFIELSFMPKALASDKNALHPFWYKQNVSPPKDWNKWDDLITQFTRHLVDRYGIDEVSQWYFEVWNEPNLDFWGGDPKQATYWQLYDHTARALKAVSPRLRVGGPATAQAAWADAFIRHCAENKVPVDFVSSHVYGNDKAEDVFGTHEAIPREDMVCRAVKKVRDQISASSMPGLPLFWTEFNASYMNEPGVTDSTYMGPWMADTIRQCDGVVDMMSYWTFSDVFEEQGVVKQPFYGGFGLIAAGGIPKPAYNAFRLLHQLGDERLAVASDSVLATRRRDGTLVVAAWNLAAPGTAGADKNVKLAFRETGVSQVTVSRVDPEHGDVHKAYLAMGSPRYPTEAQIRQLRSAAGLSAPEVYVLKNGSVTIKIPAYGLMLLEVKRAH